MMSADSPVLYSGLPQDEYNKRNYPKILSSGPNARAEKKTKYKSGLLSFLLFVLIAVLLALCIILGLNFYKYPFMLHDAFHGGSDSPQTGSASEDFNLNVSEPDTTQVLHLESLLDSISVSGNNSYNEKIPAVARETLNDSKYETISSFKPENVTVELKPLFVSSINEEIVPHIDETAMPLSTPITVTESYDNHEEILAKGQKNSSSDMETGEASNETITYAQLLDKWTSEPNAEVIVIASGIILIGISLLMTAITCFITKTRKMKRRRQKMDAVKDLGNNEKIILLTDDVSEDEIVQT